MDETTQSKIFNTAMRDAIVRAFFEQQEVREDDCVKYFGGDVNLLIYEIMKHDEWRKFIADTAGEIAKNSKDKVKRHLETELASSITKNLNEIVGKPGDYYGFNAEIKDIVRERAGVIAKKLVLKNADVQKRVEKYLRDADFDLDIKISAQVRLKNPLES